MEEKMADLLRLLSNKKRLKIIKSIRQEEGLRVKDLSEKLELRQPEVSNALAGLKLIGFVKTEKQGREVFLQVNEDMMKELIEFLS